MLKDVSGFTLHSSFIGVRYRILSKPLVSTVRIGAKTPTGFFTKDSEVIPIGDGHRVFAGRTICKIQPFRKKLSYR
ncbi:MAG: hypothetical protein ACE5JB_07330 [bacterium]